MPKTHVIQQGETLTRIARQYKYTSWQDLYNHPDNKAFRAKRENPNIIYPGDEITIPDPDPKAQSVKAGASYTFQLKKEVELFKVQIGSSSGNSWEGKRVKVDMGGTIVNTTIGKDGAIEIPLEKGDETEGIIEVFIDDDSEEPSHKFEVQLAHLDPAEEISGIQARCNLLGHDCGIVDGVMGSKTREGVRSFQEEYGLDIDGEPGPITQAKLKEIYGS